MKKKSKLIYTVTLIVICLVMISKSPGYCRDFIFSPAEGEITDRNRPLIRVSFLPEAINPASVVLKVNGADVTQAVIRSGAFIMYTPSRPLPEGLNRVEMAFRDINGVQKFISWSFRVRTKQLIKTVEHDAEGQQVEADIINVTMKAEPDLKAWFNIDGVNGNIQMEEIRPGVYSGSYQVAKGDYILNGKLTAHLVCTDGCKVQKSADKPVTIDTRFFTCKILTPLQGEKVGRNIKVTGRTTPNTEVFILSQIGMSLIGGASPVGSPAIVKVFSDDRGYFSYDYYFPITLGGLKAVIKAYAIDDQGVKSLPDQVHILLENPDKEPDDKNLKN
jgi:hypothetical protein